MRDRGQFLIGMERAMKSDSMEAGTGEEQREEERLWREVSDGGGSRERDKQRIQDNRWSERGRDLRQKTKI